MLVISVKKQQQQSHKLTEISLCSNHHLFNHFLLALDNGRVALSEFTEEGWWLRATGRRARAHTGDTKVENN